MVVDVDVLTRNLEEMQAGQDAAGIALRPHLKTAKTIAVARQALDLGAVGITVATLGEAEVFADAGVRDIFIAYPVLATGPKAARLAHLAEHSDLRIGVDSTTAVAAAAAALPASRARRVGLVVEVDSGEGRSGITPDEVPALVSAISRQGLRWDGVFTHGGHGNVAPERVESAARDEVDVLGSAKTAVAAAGYDATRARWSAGSTATARLSNRAPVTEERPGSYMLNDRHQAHLGAAPPGSHALVVAATVVSRPRAGTCILDAGAKALAKDRADYVAGHGVVCGLPGAVITAVYDHHAVVRLDPDDPEPAIGQQVAVIPNHVCPVVNLTDQLHLVSRGRLVGRWPVDTRGRH